MIDTFVDTLEFTVSEAAVSESVADLTPIVGANLRRLRVKRGLSLERMAKASGVSRAMLGQIELGHSTPTINVVWKIARALDVSFATLITERAPTSAAVVRRDRAKLLTSQDGTFTSRALFPFDEPRSVEFYELQLAPLAAEHADAHPAGTTENLVVTSGVLDLQIAAARHRLETGDAIFFEADVPHSYRNPATEPLVMYLVMSYPHRLLGKEGPAAASAGRCIGVGTPVRPGATNAQTSALTKGEHLGPQRGSAARWLAKRSETLQTASRVIRPRRGRSQS